MHISLTMPFHLSAKREYPPKQLSKEAFYLN